MPEMAESKEDTKPRFFGYPLAKEGPVTKYVPSVENNPVLSGTTLSVGAYIISLFPSVQRYLYKNAGFGDLRGLPHLSEYPERFDPTVVPVSGNLGMAPTSYTDPTSFKSYPKDLPGRYHSISDYHELYTSGKTTPLAVAKAILPLIRRDVKPLSPHSNSFISTNQALVLQAAEASTLRYQKGVSLGLLDGIPVAIKDECDVEAYPTTFGRKMNEKLSKVQDKSAWPVQRWVEAGAVVLGKLNMHELGADTTGNNPNWGTPKNPHNESFYTGGSSSGAAYAVSAGIIPFALGGDGGGSIRIPSSFCGVYGLKTSHNRVQETGSTVTVNGPIACSISDLEVAYRVMATPNPESPLCSLFSAPRPLSSTANSTRSKLLGICQSWFNRADPSVLALCNKIVKHYVTDLGYTVVDIDIPYLVQGQKAHAFTILAEMADRAKARAVSPTNWLQDLNPANKILLGVADTTPASDYLLGQQMRNLLMQHLAYLYKIHPGLIIVHPTTPMPGWPIAHYPGDLKYGISDANRSLRNMEYVWLANFTGCPAINCPVGYVDPTKGKGCIPVGITGMGEWGSEDVLIEWGREAEAYLNNEAQGGGRKKPSNWEDVLELASDHA